jgi:hypothetical protein
MHSRKIDQQGARVCNGRMTQILEQSFLKTDSNEISRSSSDSFDRNSVALLLGAMLIASILCYVMVNFGLLVAAPLIGLAVLGGIYLIYASLPGENVFDYTK